MAKDPVCGMEVNERDARYTSSYQGKEYHFCSEGCKEEFAGNPGNFVAASGVSGYGSAMRESVGQARQRVQEKEEQMKGKVQEQARSMMTEKKGTAAEGLGSVAEALHAVSQQLQGKNQAAVARYADSVAERVDRASRYLRESDTDQLIRDVKGLVRRQPGLFLGGALAAGFILARFLKSSSAIEATGRGRPMPAEAEGEAAG
ncbi:MAG: YHS domain-containing protein [Alphaproteobacteria bacterium]|uniref:YHS domain-containing protein n=1 Tax=Candidatus Nitrobium versatile TaxID=2884831 RepID=A0A953J4V6_9BACT|nr:YHS domain-containing protein [Candidatus Nitrobium versatile]